MNNGYVNKKIVISGYCGLKGAALIAKEKYGELLSRYTPSFLKVIFKDEAGDFPAEICENAFIKESFMLEAGEGGVFNALWELYKMTGCGMEVDLFKLPITQQTIEICEFYDINPYMLFSEGVRIYVTDEEYKLIDKLGAFGINSYVIGIITDNADKIIKNGSETRFIEPARGRDEINKILNGGKR